MDPEVRIVRILEAAEVLAMSDCHFRRLRDRYEAQGGESYRDVRNRLREVRERSGEDEPEDERAVVYAAMERQLETTQTVSDRELRALAKARATLIKNELVHVNEVANERVFLVEAEAAGEVTGESTDEGGAVSVHCPLRLAGG